MATQTEETKLVQLNGVDFLVDGFLFKREKVKHYVLTHFHSDHTVGLTRAFDCGTIYCTDVTAALITNMIGVEPSRVVALPLEKTFEVEGVSLTFLDAGHCPGSAMVAFEAAGVEGVVLHTGDCRASEGTRQSLLQWLGDRNVAELFLDTTYCSPRWRFVPQTVACEWLREITSKEIEREPKTLFVVGCYQIGKERAAQAVAEAAGSSVYVEQRRWKVIQLAGWGEESLSDCRPLWSIDKEGCCVWMCALGGLAHDVLKHFLDSTKGQFEAVVAFSPTGWSWSPKAMSQGSAGCRCWAENDGRTRVYSVPYSEHSSFDELQALVRDIRPRRLIPTVNSETRASKERMMAPFLDVLDLKGDPERMDHYLGGGSSSSSKPGANIATEAFVDVISLSQTCKTAQSASKAAEVFRAGSNSSWNGKLAARQVAMDLDSEDSTTAGGSSSSSSTSFALGGGHLKSSVVVDLDLEGEENDSAEDKIGIPTTSFEDDLRNVDVDQQKRLLRFFESSTSKIEQKAPSKPRMASKKSKAKGKGKGKGKSGKTEVQAEQAPVLKHLGVRPKEPVMPKAKSKRRAKAAGASSKRPKIEGPKDPKQPGEKRPARFIPKPSARVQERIDRAFSHRLYFLSRQADGDGEKLDVLGSTGNVYHVELRPTGNACSCLDFAKGGGVCKHLLFLMLRVLKLPREDHRVYQTGLTNSELQPLLCILRSEEFRAGGGVQADATVMRGYQQARGVEAGARRPLPADCPICFEEIVDEKAVDFCKVCGHNVHVDCQRRWASAGKNDTCPMCRSPWGATGGAASAEGVVNLAAYSAEHQDVNLVNLYPETHRWIQRRDAN